MQKKLNRELYHRSVFQVPPLAWRVGVSIKQKQNGLLAGKMSREHEVETFEKFLPF